MWEIVSIAIGHLTISHYPPVLHLAGGQSKMEGVSLSDVQDGWNHSFSIIVRFRKRMTIVMIFLSFWCVAPELCGFLFGRTTQLRGEEVPTAQKTSAPPAPDDSCLGGPPLFWSEQQYHRKHTFCKSHTNCDGILHFGAKFCSGLIYCSEECRARLDKLFGWWAQSFRLHNHLATAGLTARGRVQRHRHTASAKRRCGKRVAMDGVASWCSVSVNLLAWARRW